MTINTSNNEIKDFLQFLYKEAKVEERNYASRKTQLISNGMFGLTLFFLFLSLIIQNLSDIANNLLIVIILFIFLCIFMIPLFLYYGIYIFCLNQYQRIYFTTGVIIEKYLYENRFKKEKTEEDIKKEIITLLPIRRFIIESRLDRSGRYRKWFVKSLTSQNRNDLLDYFKNTYE